MARPKKVDPNKELLERLAVNFEDLVNRVTQLEAKNNLPQTITAPLPVTSENYVPPDYREAVDIILNRHFSLSIVPRKDRPEFELSVIVPEKYSTLSSAQKTMNGTDLRFKVISYAEGVNGVRDYIQQIWNTFTPEIRNQIVVDRI